MERIHYAGGSLYTGTEIARALLEYAESLALSDDSTTLDIPVRSADGSMSRATFLIGPASQLVSEEEPSEFDEVVDDKLVADIREATRRQRGIPVTPSPASEFASTGLDDLDYPNVV